MSTLACSVHTETEGTIQAFVNTGGRAKWCSWFFSPEISAFLLTGPDEPCTKHEADAWHDGTSASSSGVIRPEFRGFSINSFYLLGWFSLEHDRFQSCSRSWQKLLTEQPVLCYLDPQPDNEGQQPVTHIDGANTLLLAPTQAVTLLGNTPLLHQDQTKVVTLSLMPQAKQFTGNLQSFRDVNLIVKTAG